MRVRVILAPLSVAFLLSSLGGAAAGDAVPAADPCGPVSGEAVAVAEAVDGDTLRLTDGRTVHLAGIEAVKTSAGAPEAALAEAARLELGRLANSPGVIVSPTAVAPDRHGRIHAVVTSVNGRYPAEVLLAAGLARIRLFPGEKPCLSRLLAAEAAARAAGRGLWALPYFAVRRADDPSLLSRTGLYELVEGRVVSVGQGRRVTFLDFGQDYRRDFTIMVPIAMVAELPVPVDSLKGRRVRVRGVIEASGGPAIRLTAPGEIELLDGN